MVPQKSAIIQSTARVVLLAIILAYCLPNGLAAQSTDAQAANPQAANAGQSTTPAAPATQQTPTTGNPGQPGGSASQSPQPVTSYPDATAAGQPNSAPDAPQPKSQGSQVQGEPQGAATAEKVTTAGGAAAKPAGVAIAPAKQHQARSLLIKVGAVLAAGAAAGTVYALSRGTSSTPPGANGPGVVQKK